MKGTEGAHSMTVVGYNDAIWIDINKNDIVDSGEKGAFRVANSWGLGWEYEGFTWVAYDALYAVSQVDGVPVASHDLWSSHFMFSETHTTFSHLEKIIERKISQLSLSHLACSGPHSLRPPRPIPQLLTFFI